MINKNEAFHQIIDEYKLNVESKETLDKYGNLEDKWFFTPDVDKFITKAREFFKKLIEENND